MQTTRHPYEFLARWGRDGRLAGAHAQFRYVTMADDGTVLGEFVGAAEPVAVMEAAGFPLSDILSPLQTAALVERDLLAARIRDQPVCAGTDAMDGAPAVMRSGSGDPPAG